MSETGAEDAAMAHLWHRDTEVDWAVVRLAADAYTLVPDRPYVEPRLPGEREVGLMRTAVLDRVAVATSALQWVLLVSDAVPTRVNGARVIAGIRALDDRDEIRGRSCGPYFFSTEQRAAVTPYLAGGEPIFCPRCTLPIEPETLAVQCPVCAVWHHQNDRYKCWRYSEECAVCRHDTTLDGGFTWSPAEL